jgi:hypothetical protein
LRSRHDENRANSPTTGFGGYGISFHWGSQSMDIAREDCHNCSPSHTDLKPGSIKLPKPINKNQFYGFRITAQDAGPKVVMKGWIDYTGGTSNWTYIGQAVDNSPKSGMQNKPLYDKLSYVWLRNNGSGVSTFANLTISEIGPLTGSAYTLGRGIGQVVVPQYVDRFAFLRRNPYFS